MVKNLKMNDGCRNRRNARAIALAEKLHPTSYKLHVTPKWLKKQYDKMKKILPFTFLLTYKMTGHMEKEKNLMLQMWTGLRPQMRCQEKI